jgi:hypothetical protein
MEKDHGPVMVVRNAALPVISRKTRLQVGLTLAGILLVTFLGSIGWGTFRTARNARQAEMRAKQFLAAFIRGDFQQAEQYMSKRLQGELPPGGLRDMRRHCIEPLGTVKRGSVVYTHAGVSTSGEYLGFTYRLEGSRRVGQAVVVMVREGSTWQVNRSEHTVFPALKRP